MTLRWLAGPLLGCLLITGCGSGEPDPTAAERSGGADGAIEVLAGAPDDANAAACTATRQTLTTAIEAFTALEGTTPADQHALVAAGLVREVSPWFELTADGEVVPAGDGPCT